MDWIIYVSYHQKSNQTDMVSSRKKQTENKLKNWVEKVNNISTVGAMGAAEVCPIPVVLD